MSYDIEAISTNLWDRFVKLCEAHELDTDEIISAKTLVAIEMGYCALARLLDRIYEQNTKFNVVDGDKVLEYATENARLTALNHSKEIASIATQIVSWYYGKENGDKTKDTTTMERYELAKKLAIKFKESPLPIESDN